LGVPGFRVFRWERDWHADGQPFRDPQDYPALSVATTGTHDTEPMVVWWEGADAHERAAIGSIPSVQRVAGETHLPDAPYAAVRDILVETLFGSRSDIVLFPIQDVFGWRDRINEPATVSDENWSWRLPWPVDRLDEEATARERQAALRAWSTTHGRV
jgi:4-alpha-glucanotransferase